MGGIKEISLPEAVRQIRRTCGLHEGPFFFMVGAGISNPPVPLASEMIEECKRQAPGVEEPPELSQIDKYSFWLSRAFPSPADRQKYLGTLIKDKYISQANLHLAHILLEKRIGNLVVTTNFDDFLSRALTLFGIQHIVCDHPETIQRVRLETADVQVLHVHGTYWFYDCCNLKGEIGTRSERSHSTVFSMADFLDDALRDRSPLVVGYSGWDGDVFMSALGRRLKRQLRYNLYWFCYDRTAPEKLPSVVKNHENVFFVIPSVSGSIADEVARKRLHRPSTAKAGSAAVVQQLAEEPRLGQTLTAAEVFVELKMAFGLDEPNLTKDPLGFLANHLRASFPPERGETQGRDIYVISNVVAKIEKARKLLSEATARNELRLEKVFKAVRRSQYRQAVLLAADVSMTDLDQEHLRDLIASLWDSWFGLGGYHEQRIQCCDLILEGSELLLSQRPGDRVIRERIAKALTNKGIWLRKLDRFEEAVQVSDRVVERFGDASELVLKHQVARALVDKGLALDQLNRHEEEIQVYESVVARFAGASALILRQQVARALVFKGRTLDQLNRYEEAIQVYDSVVARFGGDRKLHLSVQVARALVDKGLALDQLNRHEEEIQVYDSVVTRFGEAVEPILREEVASALINKALALDQLSRHEEEIQVYDNVVGRFGEAAEVALRTQVASALVNKGITLRDLSRGEEAIQVYDSVVARFGDAPELSLKEDVATALVNKGITLGELNRHEEEIQVYDGVVARFGDAPELSLKEDVATALLNKGVALGVLNRHEEEVQVYDSMVARFGDAAELALREPVAKALVNKAITLGELSRREEAIQTCENVAGRFGQAAEPSLRQQVGRALLNKGLRLGELNRHEEEIQVYDSVVVRFGDAPELSLREVAASALLNKSLALCALKRHEEEVQVYDSVVARFGDAPELSLRERVAEALVNKGLTLGELSRHEEQIQTYDSAVARFGGAAELALRDWVARALLNKGVALGGLKRHGEEVQVYDSVVARFGDAPELSLRERVAEALVNKGLTLGELSRHEEQIQTYDSVVARFGGAAEVALRDWVAKALLGKGVALGGLSRHEEEIQAYDSVVARFGAVTEAPLSEQVGWAINAVGFDFLIQAKRTWLQGDAKGAKDQLREAREKLTLALERLPRSAVVLGNLAYVEFLLDHRDSAGEHLAVALEVGGEESRQAELADTQVHSLPQDEEFRNLIHSIPPQKEGSAPPDNAINSHP
jgi:tetratricopeptide (TPR) repeat protein